MSAHAHAAARHALPFHAVPAPPQNYAPVPQRLITDLHDTPLAIGVYTLIGRLFLIHHAAVPLSVPDVLRYDPTLSRGAVIRAINRLRDGGWLIEDAERGRKTRYLPTWGRIRGTPHPWRIGVACLGRPRHVNRRPVDRALLDVCMGKLTPHPVQTAPITRYLTTPVLSLTDVGCYALTLEGLARETPALRRIGAVRAGVACPLPDAPQLLALISQQTLDIEPDQAATSTLTLQGTHQLGMAPYAPGAATDPAQPLFFVPPGLIGSMIGPVIAPMIGQHAVPNTPDSAPASGEMLVSNRAKGITWESRQTSDEAIPPQPPQQVNEPAGGGGKAAVVNLEFLTQRDPKKTLSVMSIPDTAATRLLATINVLPEQQIELADLPADVVQAALADAQARPGLRDQAGWVVKLLRNHRAYGWTIRPAAPAQRWGAVADDSLALPDGPEAVVESQADVAAAGLPAQLTRLWSAVQATLQHQLTRQEFNTWVRGARLVDLAAGVATLVVATPLVQEVLAQRYHTAVCDALRLHCGYAVVRLQVICHVSLEPGVAEMNTTPAVAYCTAAPQALPPMDDGPDTRPDWIAAADWENLPPLLRAALIGACWADGGVQARTAHLQHLIESRFPAELAMLAGRTGAITVSEDHRAAHATDQPPERPPHRSLQSAAQRYRAGPAARRE